MIEYTKAEAGYRFCLTAKGKQLGRVRTKFMVDSPQYKRGYQHSVPTAWVNNGWVKQVKEQTNGN